MRTSKKLKYTPGPWFVQNGRSIDGTRGFAIKPIPRDVVAVTDPQATKEEEECNAHLIAAAPELFEACEVMLEVSEIDNLSRPGTRKKQITYLKSVIAKAKGEA